MAVMAQSESILLPGGDHIFDPPVTVRVPRALQTRTGAATINVRAGTVRDVIEALERTYPGLRFNLCVETGDLRPYINIFVGPEDVRWLQGLDTPVSPGATIHILQSVAGG